MNTKNIIVIAIAVCVLGLGAGIISKMSGPRTISVGGECLTSAPKDRTAITLRVSVTDKSAAKSMRVASAKVAEINEYLKTKDVKVQTSEFNSFEKNEWNRETQKSEFVGIETNIALDVSASNVGVIEEILTKFAGQPDVFVSNLRMFTATETMKPILESCLGMAVENARSRAEALAAGAGRRVGPMLAVSYGSGASYDVRPVANYRMAKAEMLTAATADYAGGAITAKDTEISVSVSAVFEIK